MSRLSKEREGDIRCMLEDCPPEQGDADVLAEVLGELDAVRAERDALQAELALVERVQLAVLSSATRRLLADERRSIIEAAKEQP